MRMLTEAQWNAEGEALFGHDRMNWRFKCPVCGHEASVRDWKNVGASSDEVAFSCIGRHISGARDAFTETRKGPCSYAGGGLFRLNPVRVGEHELFEFGSPVAKAVG